MTATTTTANLVPLSDRTIPVHKKDCEGVLFVNAMTGIVQQPLDERPEWSDGLAVALLVERHGYYTSRLGQQYADAHRQPDAFAYEDLGWIGLDDEGEPVEIEADAEHRMETLAEVLGTDREDGGTVLKGTLAEIELSLDRVRTEGELSAFEHAQEAGFASATGTNG